MRRAAIALFFLAALSSVVAKPGCTEDQLRTLCHFMDSGLVEPTCEMINLELTRISSKVYNIEKFTGTDAGCLLDMPNSLCDKMVSGMPQGPLVGAPLWPCQNIHCKTWFGDCFDSMSIDDKPIEKPDHKRTKLVPLPKSCDTAALPSSVPIKTNTASFNHKYEFVVHCRRVWYRERKDLATSEGWKLLSNDGLPKPPFKESDQTKLGPIDIEDNRSEAIKSYKATEGVAGISADGDNLVVFGENGIVYYTKIQGFVWQGRWGLNNLASDFMDMDLGPPGWVTVPEGSRALAISHRGGYNEYYTDYLGHKFEQPVGVTTLYNLNENGFDITYADPWLPVDFRNSFCGPERNSLELLSLSASCSTMMAMDTAGNVWTRFVDYDTAGNNPIFPYSLHCFDEARFDYDTSDWTPRSDCTHLPGKNSRALPPEGWKSHGRPGGHGSVITKIVTIAQNGHDTVAREMSVVGKKDGVMGLYYKKSMTETHWSFSPTEGLGSVSEGDWVPAGSQQNLRDKNDVYFRSHLKDGWQLSVTNFNPDCPPARIILAHPDGTKVFTGTLHYHMQLRSFQNTRRYIGVLLMDYDFVQDQSMDAKAIRSKFVNTYNEHGTTRAFMRVGLFYTPAKYTHDNHAALRVEALGDGFVVPFTGASVEYRLPIPRPFVSKGWVWQGRQVKPQEATVEQQPTEHQLAVLRGSAGQ